MASIAMSSSSSGIVGALKFDLKSEPSGKFFPVVLPSIRARRPRVVTLIKSSIDNGSGSSGPVKKLGMTDAECEAAVVAGNVPEAPPVPPKPAAPAGTPVVSSLVSVLS